MKITIIHPSRGRAKQAFAVQNKWLASVYDIENVAQYLMSIDIDDAHNYGVGCVVSDNRSAIDAINNAAKVATGDIFVVVSDDFDCPLHWDKLLLDAIGDKTDFVAKTDDGQQPWIITLPIMDRVYYNRFGYIYNPDYLHMFCDTEMTHVADLLGRKITLPIKFPHNHYTTGMNPKDAINVKNDATWNQGEALYLQRAKDNFGIPKSDVVPDFKLPAPHQNWLRSKGAIL